LLVFPIVLWLLLLIPTAALTASIAIYVFAHQFDWNAPSYPSGHWIINPFHWQLLFVFGAWCGLYASERLEALLNSRIVFALAIVYLAFALFIVMTWRIPWLGAFVPRWLHTFMYPIDKTNLDVLRFAHFLAVAVLVVRVVPKDGCAFGSVWLRPAILCGQHSLEIFCLGIFLSFAGHFVIVEISGSIWMQVAVSVAGIAAMSAVASLINWFERVEERGPSGQKSRSDADIAGG
jgi:hypothetical protein